MVITPKSSDYPAWEIRSEFLNLDVRKKIGLAAIPVSLSLIAILSLLDISMGYDSPFLLLSLHAICIGFISLAIAFLTGRVFAKSGSVSVFLIGSGLLTFGLGLISASWLHAFTGDQNLYVTIGNTSACFGSVLILIGALVSMYGPLLWSGGERSWIVAAVYSVILFCISLFSLATMQGLVPFFYIEGIGPTLIREIFLENTIIFVAISSLLCMFSYLRRRSEFFFWYSVAFALISIGLFTTFPPFSPGTPVVWVGRITQYLGFVSALYAVFVAQRAVTTQGLLLEEVIANFFFDAEQSYKMLMETVTDAIVTFDENYRVILWNSAAERMFGYTRDEAVGSSFPEIAIYDPYIMALKNEGLDITAQGQQNRVPKTIEITGKRKDGTLFPVELTFSYRKKKGRMIQTGILRDLTERRLLEDELLAVNQGLETKVKERTEEISRKTESLRRTHEELSASYKHLAADKDELSTQYEEIKSKNAEIRESALKYQNLVETLQEGIWVIDTGMNTTFVNRHMAEMLGYTFDEMKGRSLFDFMGIKGREIAEQNRQNPISGIQGPQDFEFLKKDGSQIYVTLETRSLIDDEGNDIGMLAGVMDITERRRGEDEIKLQNIILSTQQETSLDGILTLDEHGKIISFNQRFINLWGISEDVIASRSAERAFKMVSGKVENSEEFLAMVKHLHEHTEEENRRVITLVDGSILDRFSAPMLGKDGRNFGRVWYFRDITNEKLAEREILTLNQDLEGRVDERTRDLLQLNSQLTAINEELAATEEELQVQIDEVNEAYASLEKSEERSRRLYESDLIGIAFADLEKILDSNDTFLAMIGYSKDDLTSGSVTRKKITPPEYEDADLKGIEELRVRGSCTPYEKEFFCKDGSRVPVMFGAALLEKNPLTWVCFIQDITGRKQTEEKLLLISDESRLARDYAESIVDTVREPLVVLNGSFEVISASRSFYSTFEVTPEATLGKVLYELGNNQWDIPRLHELLETVLPESTSFDNFDIEHEFPGIGHRNMLLNARRILSETGNTELILLVIEDITNRKQIEEKLLLISEESRLARDYAESIVDTVREPLVVLNGSFEVISASRSFYSTFEVTSEATLGKVLYELGNNQWDIPRLHELLETVLPESTSFDNFDIEHEFPGIGHRNMLLNARRILSEIGNTELILLVIEDITDRKQIEEKLLLISEESRLARDYAESIVDTVREPLVVLNGSFEVISASRSFYSTFEVTSEATLGKVLYELGNNQWDIPRLHELLETVLPESTSFDNFDIEHGFPGIGHRNMLLNARRILSETGNTELILLVIEDITERKKLTAQIEASLAEKETLLREIHHRVKNNLQTIVSLLNLQIRRIDDSVTIEALKESQSRVRSMALVHEHLYQGKDLSHIDLVRYIKALGAGIFQSFEAGRRGIRFEINISNIYVDINIAVPLGLISTELVTNSLKYAFPGDDDAIISFACTEYHQTLNFIVADNGIGIPEEITLDNQNSMGLRLVSTLTDQLNGTVVIDRTEGTKFIFVFPKSMKDRENE